MGHGGPYVETVSPEVEAPPAGGRRPAVDVAAPGPRRQGRAGDRAGRGAGRAGRRRRHRHHRLCHRRAVGRLRARRAGQPRGRGRSGARRMARPGGRRARAHGGGDEVARRVDGRRPPRAVHPCAVLRVRTRRPRQGRVPARRGCPGDDARRYARPRRPRRGAVGSRQCRAWSRSTTSTCAPPAHPTTSRGERGATCGARRRWPGWTSRDDDDHCTRHRRRVPPDGGARAHRRGRRRTTSAWWRSPRGSAPAWSRPPSPPAWPTSARTTPTSCWTSGPRLPNCSTGPTASRAAPTPMRPVTSGGIFSGGCSATRCAGWRPSWPLWQAVDRLAAGEEIARWAPGARVLVQVNVSGEPQKHGCAAGDVPRLVDGLRGLGLDVAGLMAVGATGGPELAPGARSGRCRTWPISCTWRSVRWA